MEHGQEITTMGPEMGSMGQNMKCVEPKMTSTEQIYSHNRGMPSKNHTIKNHQAGTIT
jgi:hypothetical protein